MQLENEILRFERQHQCLSVMMLDLDDFKSINDTYGHPVGDEVLVETANTISRLCRAIDTAGRFGGEEFFLVLPNTTAGEAIQLGERLCTEIAELAIDAKNSIVRFTCSIGAAQFMEDDTIDSIIKKADDALYEAKHRGKNQIVFQKLA